MLPLRPSQHPKVLIHNGIGKESRTAAFAHRLAVALRLLNHLHGTRSAMWRNVFRVTAKRCKSLRRFCVFRIAAQRIWRSPLIARRGGMHLYRTCLTTAFAIALSYCLVRSYGSQKAMRRSHFVSLHLVPLRRRRIDNVLQRFAPHRILIITPCTATCESPHAKTSRMRLGAYPIRCHLQRERCAWAVTGATAGCCVSHPARPATRVQAPQKRRSGHVFETCFRAVFAAYRHQTSKCTVPLVFSTGTDLTWEGRTAAFVQHAKTLAAQRSPTGMPRNAC